VIGTPTLAALDPQLGNSAAPGIGFAIPGNTVKSIATLLVTRGTAPVSAR
jgi:S1-C subfamily serine protease